MSGPPPDEFPPPVNPDELGLGPMVMGLTWTFSGLAVITTLVRLYVRKRISPRLAIEDWLMLVAMILQLTNQIFITVGFHYGMGKHQWNLYMPDEAINIFKWGWFAVPPGLVSGMFGRISICIFLVRLFGVHTWFKHYAIVLTALGVAVNIAICILSFASRDPVESLWNPLVQDTMQWDPIVVQSLMFLGQSFYAVADLTFVIFPIVIVSKLNMSLGKRLGLCALIALSLVTCAMSILKGVSAHNSQSGDDATQAAALSQLWATLEQAFVVLLGNLVPLRPLLKLDIPIVNTITHSMASLLRRTSRGSSRGTSHNSGKPSSLGGTSESTGAYQDIEMNTHGLGNKKNTFWRSIRGGGSFRDSSAGSVAQNQVRRTDEFEVEFGSTGGSPQSRRR